MSRRVVDFHVHMASYDSQSESLDKLMCDTFGSMEAFEAFSQRYADPDNFVRHLREQGVDYAVILEENCPLTTGVLTHERVAEFCKGRPELIPFCTVNPYVDGDMPGRIRRLCGEQGFRGIKLYPTYNHFHVNDPRMYPMYAVAMELQVPVLIHTGTSVFRNARLKYGNPIDVDDVAMDFPDLTLVMAHGGRGAWYDEAMTMVRLHANAYIDVSGLPVRKLLGWFPEMERFSHKFIFGTDWPQVMAGHSLARFAELGLSEEALDRILGGNALRILGLE